MTSPSNCILLDENSFVLFRQPVIKPTHLSNIYPTSSSPVIQNSKASASDQVVPGTLVTTNSGSDLVRSQSAVRGSASDLYAIACSELVLNTIDWALDRPLRAPAKRSHHAMRELLDEVRRTYGQPIEKMFEDAGLRRCSERQVLQALTEIAKVLFQTGDGHNTNKTTQRRTSATDINWGRIITLHLAYAMAAQQLAKPDEGGRNTRLNEEMERALTQHLTDYHVHNVKLRKWITDAPPKSGIDNGLLHFFSKRPSSPFSWMNIYGGLVTLVGLTLLISHIMHK